MSKELTVWDSDIHWLNNECKLMGIPKQDMKTCTVFAQKVYLKWCKVQDTDLARVFVFSEMFGVN